MSYYKEEIESFLSGECLDDEETLTKYSRDASLLEVKPKLVVFPKDAKDIKKLVKFVGYKKKEDPSVSITVRAAGTCMSGGGINESIILDISKYMHGVLDVDAERKEAKVLPGTYYRDFEKETLKYGLIFPSYTASKDLCAVGGMVGNNAGGEKTLLYGKTENYVKELKVIFEDGNEYAVKPLSKEELKEKISRNDFEGKLYERISNVINENFETLKEAKPKVSKNSAGYYLWNVWDEKMETFNLNKLIVGSQGTLGIVTEITFRLVPVKTISKLVVVFMKDFKYLSEGINEILKFHPESLESYDHHTMKLAVRFFPGIVKSMKVKNILKLGLSFLPEFWMMIAGGIPKMILLVEFSGENEEEINKKALMLKKDLIRFPFKVRVTKSREESEKYWTVRRESFSLLRAHTKGRRTAPFIDDVIVEPKYLPEFLPKLQKILNDYKLIYTIAGHAGDGNFHVIPLMDMRRKENLIMIPEISEKVYDLVSEYGGSITAEHNDGIIRSAYLGKMFDEKVIHLFERTKEIFDHANIFNPGKKVNVSIKYLIEHLARS